jgi:uncharacterized protein YfiM (DUF2279 family)
MTLKAVHVAFIAVATLTTAGFGVWSLHAYSTAREAMSLFMGSLSLALAAGLVVYGGWFLKKMKDVSYL